MSLKSYCRETLNDNWYEERQKPLNGVIANYNVKCFETTSNSTYSYPVRKQVVKGSIGMLSRTNLKQFKKDRIYVPRGFGESQKISLGEKLEGTTSNHRYFGENPKLTHIEQRRQKSSARKPAGLIQRKTDPRDNCGDEALPPDADETPYFPRRITYGLTAQPENFQRISQPCVFQDSSGIQ